MSYYRFQARLRKKSGGKKIKPYLAVLLISLGVVFFYFIIFEAQSGLVGRQFSRLLLNAFGKCALVFAVFLIFQGILLFREKNQKNLVLWSIEFVLLCGLVGFVKIIAPAAPNYAGVVGANVAEFFRRLFGPVVGLLFNLGLFVYVFGVIRKISFAELLAKLYNTIRSDIEEYRKVKELSKKLVKKEQPQPKDITVSSPPPNEKKQEPVKKVIQTASDKIQRVAPAPAANTDETSVYKNYKLPTAEILTTKQISQTEEKHQRDLARAQILVKTLNDFGIKVEIGDIIPGPVVTRYDIILDAGVKYQSITTLSDNLSLALKAASIRIVQIAEKSAVGIEVPNQVMKIVSFRDIIVSDEFQKSSSPLTFALGQTTDGNSTVTDIIPMPHLLIAGATGSGKSIAIHSLILSILFKARPDEVKFILIDPKRIELPIYEGLPHIYDPSVSPEEARIITQPKKAMIALKHLVYVMEHRYELFARHTVRNIDAYNEKVRGHPELDLQPVHYIIVIIDELADLMLVARKEIEDDIQRLAQMARAVGIHLVLATQRPSVDVITGVIKANFSARIAFQTTSKVDSRVVLDSIGAEDLLGRGDMLFLPPGAPKPVRLQGTYVSAKDAENVVKFICAQDFKPSYFEYTRKDDVSYSEKQKKDEKSKEHIISALKLVVDRRRVSQDLLKAHFGSSARATDVLSLLEKDGFIFKPEGTNRWSIDFAKISEFLKSEAPAAEVPN